MLIKLINFFQHETLTFNLKFIKNYTNYLKIININLIFFVYNEKFTNCF